MKSLIPWKWGKREEPAFVAKDWLDRLWHDPFESLLPSSGRTFSWDLAAMDVSEDKKEVTVRVEIPGLSEKDLELTYQNGMLHIRGEKREEHESKKKNAYYRECSYGSFSRDIPLRKGLDWEHAKAKYKRGVLTVSLPKTVADEKRIEVEIH